jgi:hypothetical protein
VPLPPPATKDLGVASSATWHLVGDGPVEVVDDELQAAATIAAAAASTHASNIRKK